MAILIIFLVPAALMFGLALLFPRAATPLTWIIGCLPAIALAMETRETLGDPMVIFWIVVVMGVPAIAGALTGAQFARRFRARRSAASARSDPAA